MPQESKLSGPVSRRQFLRGAAALSAGVVAGFPAIVPSSALGKDGAVAPSNRLALGVIGCGGRGMANTNDFLNFPEMQIVALCDVDERQITSGRKSDAVRKKIGDAEKLKLHRDFREICARKDIDIMLVATPDHWHGLASCEALKNGKDVYCEKPLANSVAEGRAIADAVKKHNRVLQTGSQERSGPNARYAAELVRNGRIGKVHTVTITLPDDQAQHKKAKAYEGVPKGLPVPKELDWSQWLGHTPMVPYHPDRCHFMWRFILAHGGGEMTDRGAHVIDLAGLGLNTDDTGPIEFEAHGKQTPDSLYDTFWDYNFNCTYANGVKMVGTNQGARGIKFEGTDGWIFIAIHGGKLTASKPELLKETIGAKEIQLGRTPHHKRNFLDCVRSRQQPFAQAETGHRTASICHLINLSMKLGGKKLAWDPKAERITNDASANQYLLPKMREGFVL